MSISIWLVLLEPASMLDNRAQHHMYFRHVSGLFFQWAEYSR
jgi:hypothetical protein